MERPARGDLRGSGKELIPPKLRRRGSKTALTRLSLSGYQRRADPASPDERLKKEDEEEDIARAVGLLIVIFRAGPRSPLETCLGIDDDMVIYVVAPAVRP